MGNHTGRVCGKSWEVVGDNVMVLFDTYDMIQPIPGSLKEYELFYNLYSQNIKNNILENQVFKELKYQLSNINTEIIQSLKKEEALHDVNLTLVGLEHNKGKRYEYPRGLSNSDSVLLNKYFNGDYDLYIDFTSNYQQVIIIYSLFETTIKAYLKSKYNFDSQRQKNLIEDLLNNETDLAISYKNLTNSALSNDDINNLWLYYTNIRNLYSHSGGIIGSEFIDKMQKLQNGIQQINDNHFLIESSVANSQGYELFQLSQFVNQDLFKINEYNLRFFRNFLVNIWESIYITYNTPCVSNEIVKIEPNTFQMKVYNTEKSLFDIQTMPEMLTSYTSHFYINGYLCPRCVKNGLFLYKVAFRQGSIDVSEILAGKKDSNYLTERAFCCPCCKSFYFPRHGKKLTDGDGFNILDISDNQYIQILDILDKLG